MDTRRLLNEMKVYAASLQPTPIQRRCVVVARGRTGSTLLMSLLDSHPKMIGDGEILSSRRRLPRRYVLGAERVAARRKPGAHVYGFKLLAYQLARVHPRHLSVLVPYLYERGWEVVHLVRANLLKQVLSHRAASRTQFHHRQPVEHDPFPVDIEQLRAWLERGRRAAETERRILGDVPHLVLTYETDLEPYEAQQGAADRVFARVGLNPHPVASTLVKALPARVADIVSNYGEVDEALRGTPFERYLDQ